MPKLSSFSPFQLHQLMPKESAEASQSGTPRFWCATQTSPKACAGTQMTFHVRKNPRGDFFKTSKHVGSPRVTSSRVAAKSICEKNPRIEVYIALHTMSRAFQDKNSSTIGGLPGAGKSFQHLAGSRKRAYRTMWTASMCFLGLGRLHL